MADKEVTIKITSEDNTKKGINSAKKSMQGLEKTSKTTTSSISSGFKAVGGVIAAAMATKAIVDFGAQSVMAAADSKQLADTLKTRLGASYDELIPKLKKASAGTVNSYELMKSASKAMELGVTQDVDKMAQMMEVARIKAQKMGIDSTQAFDDLVTGVGRGSPLILDNLGIIIDDGMKELMKTMDEVEKKEFLVQAIIDSEELGNTIITTKERFDALKATFDDLKVKIGNELMPTVIELLDFIEDNQEAIELLAKVFVGLVKVAVGALKNIVVHIQYGIDMVKAMGKDVEALRHVFKGEFGKAADDVDAAAELIKGAADRINNNYINTAKDIASTFDSEFGNVEDDAKDMENTNKQVTTQMQGDYRDTRQSIINNVQTPIDDISPKLRNLQSTNTGVKNIMDTDYIALATSINTNIHTPIDATNPKLTTVEITNQTVATNMSNEYIQVGTSINTNIHQPISEIPTYWSTAAQKVSETEMQLAVDYSQVTSAISAYEALANLALNQGQSYLPDQSYSPPSGGSGGSSGSHTQTHRVWGNVSIKKSASGGFVRGSGVGDKIPALLEPGEFVLNRKATARNLGMLNSLNMQTSIPTRITSSSNPNPRSGLSSRFGSNLNLQAQVEAAEARQASTGSAYGSSTFSAGGRSSYSQSNKGGGISVHIGQVNNMGDVQTVVHKITSALKRTNAAYS